jgi:aromatic-L-amino-acid decarboxylase
LPTAALADLVSGLTNRFIGIAAAAPLLVRIETAVLRFLLDEFRFPSHARAVLTSGGSVANLIAMAAARDRTVGEEVARGTVYVSDQVHHSNTKAAHLVGFRRSNVRLLPVDGAFRIRLDALEAAVAADRATGLAPAVVIGNAGTVHSGALDPLPALADFCARERLWFHVDGAYGACFELCDEGRRRLAGIERADSISLDPHKGLFLPYGTGGVLVRDGADLRRPFAQQSAYLPQASADDGLQDFTDVSPELSRDFRGLRLWLSLRTFGARAFRLALSEKLELAARAHREVAAIAGLEMLGPCDLSLFAFRIARPGATGDELTRELLVRVNRRQRVFLSGTQLGGRFALRICVLSFRTHADRIDDAVTALREETAGLLAGR